MTTLGPLLQGFFTDRLARQRHASDHTVLAYRNTIRLLLRFAWQKTGRQPAQLTLEATPERSPDLSPVTRRRGGQSATRRGVCTGLLRW